MIEDGTWYYEGVRFVTEQGLITGTASSTLSPGGSSTRAQAAVILSRFCISSISIFCNVNATRLFPLCAKKDLKPQFQVLFVEISGIKPLTF
ncbi:S-layer homology domain-containing protein [Pseudoflavonifractor sp. CLA-AP-H29]|uniref:S-layer homology domain-containing protein n=1 Tax=Pseudoflavonifractor intestinihominis TaxID=3133171 RepID=A0ABV1EBK1_9FIRM